MRLFVRVRNVVCYLEIFGGRVKNLEIISHLEVTWRLPQKPGVSGDLASMVPTPQPKPRTTIRVLSSVRSLQQDETNQFEEIDKIIPEDFIDKIKTRTFNNIPVVCYQIDQKRLHSVKYTEFWRSCISS